MVLHHVLPFADVVTDRLAADTVTGQLAVLSVMHTSEARGPNMGGQLGAMVVAPKLGYQYTLAGSVLAPDVQHLKQEFLNNAS